MRTIKKILFPVILTAFVCFFLGQDIAKSYHLEKGKIENTNSGSGSRSFCSSESSAEEEVSFILEYYSDDRLLAGDKNLSSLLSDLPLQLYYSIWLPPDNS